MLSRVALGALAVLAVAGTGPALAALPAPVTLEGVAGVRPGLPVAAVEERWGVGLDLLSNFGPSCEPAEVTGGGMEGFALFAHGRFASVQFYRGARTARGVRIGSTLRQLRRAYGAALISRSNEYTPGARDYFVRRSRAPHWLLRFDVSPGRRVTSIGFGNDYVGNVEGCA